MIDRKAINTVISTYTYQRSTLFGVTLKQFNSLNFYSMKLVNENGGFVNISTTLLQQIPQMTVAL